MKEAQSFLDDRVRLLKGDSREMLKLLPDASIDAVITDPPYALVSITKRFGKDGSAPPSSDGATGVYKRAAAGFMGKQWDTGETAFAAEFWAEVLRVLKPGAHVVAFSGTRTYHRMACAIEDAGFEIRDQIGYASDSNGPRDRFLASLNDEQRVAYAAMMDDAQPLGMAAWTYGSGFPKSHSVSNAIHPMVQSRYGKQECNCVDTGHGRPAGNHVGRGDRQEVRLQRAAGDETTKGSGDCDVSVKVGRKSAVRHVRKRDPAQTPGSSPIEEAVLLEGVRELGTEAPGHRHAAVRAGVEEYSVSGSSARQGVSMLREDAGAERSRTTCSSPEAVPFRRDEQSEESRGPMRDLPSQDRSGDGAGFVVDPDRRSARQVIADDQGGRQAAVAHVCSWCGLPDRDWSTRLQQLGTALKPAWEPICLARKPLAGTVAANVLAHGTGALNIDGCRVEGEKTPAPVGEYRGSKVGATGLRGVRDGSSDHLGRWPANVIHDGGEEVLACFPEAPGQQRALLGGEASKAQIYGNYGPKLAHEPLGDAGSAARFFYTAKADADDRLGSKHPTVKPLDLMQWLVRLVCPKGGTVLDPFAGTGTTGEAAWREGMRAVLVEREPEYQADICRRMDLAAKPTKRAATAKGKGKLDDPSDLPLFGAKP